jgi:aminoglycoside phosphotransferase (APT) family kinase protein
MWQSVDLDLLPADVKISASFDPKPTLEGFLSPRDLRQAVEDMAQLLDAPPSWIERWMDALYPVASLTPVLAHGDVCEGQLLVDADGRVGTIIDWDAAGISHPLHDFDFSEWGFGIFRWEDDFPRLRRAMWDGYSTRVNVADLPDAAAVHLAFTLSELHLHELRHRQGSLDAWGEARLQRLRRAVGPATEAAV